VVVNPNGARSQVEGSLLFGISNALEERITIQNSQPVPDVVEVHFVRGKEYPRRAEHDPRFRGDCGGLRGPPSSSRQAPQYGPARFAEIRRDVAMAPLHVTSLERRRPLAPAPVASSTVEDHLVTLVGVFVPEIHVALRLAPRHDEEQICHNASARFWVHSRNGTSWDDTGRDRRRPTPAGYAAGIRRLRDRRGERRTLPKSYNPCTTVYAQDEAR